MNSPSESPPLPASSNKAYSVLLFMSLCLSAVLCWLYVTKPVIVTPSSDVQNKDRKSSSLSNAGTSTSAAAASSKHAKPQLVPSDSALPGVKSKSSGGVSKISKQTNPKPIDPLKLLASGDGSGWETTNSRVQHILRADAGNGNLTNIVLNVPVLYQTRTMRWTPVDVKKARDILTRLMVYENNLSKIKLEGRALLVDWNRLLEKTVPSSALRADSPSLPYNHSQTREGRNLPDSGNAIKVE